MSDVPAAIRRLARWIEDDAELLAQRMGERARGEVSQPPLDGDPALVEVGHQAGVAHLRAICGGLTGGRMLPAQPPPAAVEQTLSLASEGISWTTLMRRFTFAHAELWECILEEIDDWELSADERTLLLQITSRYLFSYRDYISTELTEVYQAQRERLVRSREHRRIGLVRELLDGLPASDDELDYRLKAHHVAAIASGQRPEQAITELARRGGYELLFVPGGGRSLWAWYGGSATLERRLLATLREQPPPEGTWLALGAQAAGLDGFGRTHREAMQAFRVAAVRPRAVTRYDDVVLESLALSDERSAREFAARELGALAASDQRTATLRTTLSMYFRAGQNRAAAAALLAVHERTVGYRLSAIEKLLGHDIGARREELGVALKVQRLLESQTKAVGS
ncbi:MAG TPA: helix-turn-helix domain-containing protein [Thermoleophilaceae bacterium]